MQSDDACYLDHGVSGYGVAVKLHHERPVEGHLVGDLLREMMDAIARDCVERGARFIGHIKSHLVCAQGTLKSDTIGIGHPAELHGELSGPAKDVYVAVNSIVQGITEGQVKEATLGATHRLAAEYGFRVMMEKEHMYFDQYDFSSDEEYLEQLEAQLDAGPED